MPKTLAFPQWTDIQLVDSSSILNIYMLFAYREEEETGGGGGGPLKFLHTSCILKYTLVGHP